MRQDSSMCATWLAKKWTSRSRQRAYLSTHSRVWQDSSIVAEWFTKKGTSKSRHTAYSSTHLRVWQDSSMFCDMTRKTRTRDSKSHQRAFSSTHSRVWQDSSICAAWVTRKWTSRSCQTAYSSKHSHVWQRLVHMCGSTRKKKRPQDLVRHHIHPHARHNTHTATYCNTLDLKISSDIIFIHMPVITHTLQHTATH